jgi:glutathione synthase/RimK-type ligase-like ATP-grasp enzyme
MARSSSPKIALFANKDSKQLLTLKTALSDTGAQPLVFDVQLGGPGKARVCISEGKISWDNVDFKDVHAVHIRCTSPNTLPAMPPVLNDLSFAELRTAFVREQYFQGATYSFFEQLAAQNKLVINQLSTYSDHDSKSQFYEKLRAWGFDAPVTLTTNDPDQADKFIARFDEVVVKPAIGVGSTRVVTDQDKKRLDEIVLCPVMMQERVVGDTIRVHIVADTVVLALRIISDGGVDSRTATKGFEYFELPEEQQHMLVDANRRLGLHYSAWDVIASPEGRFSYLDCNPGPYIMWIGDENTRAVFQQLANYMIGYSETLSIEEASNRVCRHVPQSAH